MDNTLLSLTGMAVERGASDLHLSPGLPPRIRLHGDLQDLTDKPLTNQQTTEMMKLILAPEQQNEVTGPAGVADAARFFSGERFRINIFKKRLPADEQEAQGIAMVLRHLPNKIFSFQQLGLPPVIGSLLEYKRGGGIFLVTGPTGSGKTTTLASMVDYINANRAAHIITIEAPVEIVHQSKKSIVSQREMPIDTPSFKDAVRDALREDPDVILVGEMRDLETISAAVSAAETGHLVLATLHTNSAVDTIDRIVDSFPANQKEQIRTQLAMTVKAILSQALVRKADQRGRVAAFELMITNHAIKNHIRQGDTHRITSVIQTQGSKGMTLFDDSLRRLISRSVITLEEALRFARSPEDFSS